MSEIRNLVEAHGARNAALTLLALLESGGARYDEMNLHDLATAFMGSGWHEGPLGQGRNLVEARQLLETGSGSQAVNSTAFKVITSQIMIMAMMDGAQGTRLVGDSLVRTVPTKLLGAETIPGVEGIKGGSGTVKEGTPYPKRGLGERTQTTPEKIKQGLILALTKELITATQSGLAQARLMDKARAVGFEPRYNKEERILRAVLGLTNSYVENKVSLNTYYLAGDTHPFQAGQAAADPNAVYRNKVANNLADHTDVNVLLQLFNRMSDPATGRPVLVQPDTYLITPGLEMTAHMVLRATEVRVGTNPISIASSPVPGALGRITPVVSEIAGRLLVASGLTQAQADQYQVLFEKSKAFWYQEVWPTTITEAPADHPDNFNNDIVSQFKASEFGEVMVADPRSTVLATNE